MASKSLPGGVACGPADSVLLFVLLMFMSGRGGGHPVVSPSSQGCGGEVGEGAPGWIGVEKRHPSASTFWPGGYICLNRGEEQVKVNT